MRKFAVFFCLIVWLFFGLSGDSAKQRKKKLPVVYDRTATVMPPSGIEGHDPDTHYYSTDVGGEHLSWECTSTEISTDCSDHVPGVSVRLQLDNGQVLHLLIKMVSYFRGSKGDQIEELANLMDQGYSLDHIPNVGWELTKVSMCKQEDQSHQQLEENWKAEVVTDKLLLEELKKGDPNLTDADALKEIGKPPDWFDESKHGNLQPSPGCRLGEFRDKFPTRLVTWYMGRYDSTGTPALCFPWQATKTDKKGRVKVYNSETCYAYMTDVEFGR